MIHVFSIRSTVTLSVNHTTVDYKSREHETTQQQFKDETTNLQGDNRSQRLKHLRTIFASLFEMNHPT